jgi:CheY-like chemotaxis protein
VMAVDDDPQILAILQALLESQGIRLTPLTDPLRFWDVLQQESSPEVWTHLLRGRVVTRKDS